MRSCTHSKMHATENDMVSLVDAGEDWRTETEIQDEEWRPEEGGKRAWTVVAACFFVNGAICGFEYVSSIIYVELLHVNENLNLNNLATQTSLVLSLATGASCLLCPPASFLVDRVGYRKAGVLGGVLAALSLLASSWLLQSIIALYFTFSLLFGFAMAVAEVASIPLLGLYFRRRLGLVNGVVTSANSIFGVLIPQCIKFALPSLGLSGVFQACSGVMLLTAFCALAFVVPKGVPKNDPMQGWQLINTKIWRNKKYVAWCVTTSFAWFGFFVPFVHIVKYASLNFPEEDGYILTICLNITSIVSRILFGIVSDLEILNTITLQQGTFILTGVFTLLVPLVNSWPLMISVTLLIGMLNGGFYCLVGPIATQLCGVSGAVQAIGFMYGVNTLSFVAGPVVAGYLFDSTNSYFVPFLVAGSSIILGGLLMSSIRFLKLPAED